MFYLHVILHMTKPGLHPFTLNNHSGWASFCAIGSSDRWSADLPQGTTFYNSNCSKHNGSASPSRKTQLDNTKLRSTAMVPGSWSCKNAPQRSRLGTAIQMLLGTSLNKGLLHQAIHFCIDSFLQAEANCLKSAGHQKTSSQNSLVFDRVQSFFLRESGRLKGFRIYHLELY